MESASLSPLFDLFRKGEVPRDVRLLAARGTVAPTVHEQLLLLVLLAGDRDAEIAEISRRTLDGLPRDAVVAFLARSPASDDVRAYFRARGGGHAPPGADDERAPPGGDRRDTVTDLEEELERLLASALPEADVEDAAGTGDTGPRRNIASLPIIDRMKLAMRGTRDQRAVLIRDPNKLVSACVLSSPKVSEAEVEGFAKMANVSDDVLRIIGTNRAWTRSYAVVSALSRNPKTPPAIAMPLVSRLNERDLKSLSVDRNVPDGVRLVARKLIASGESRRR